jgi:hypothetical protein
MKKFSLCLLIFFAISSPKALADQAYFGVGFYPFFPGIQIAYDFDLNSSGFGVRGAVASMLIISGFSLDAYYRVPLSTDGLNTYLGAGVGGDLILSLGVGAFARWNVHGLIGLAGPVNSQAHWFVEVPLGVAFSEAREDFYFGAAFGLNFLLQK